MRLLVDLGNTRLRWALLDPAGSPGRVASVVHAGRSLDDVLADAWSGLAPPESVLLCSVADAEATGAVMRWCRQRWGAAVERVEARAEGWGVRNAYHEPALLGPDRWAALVGARALFPDRPVCVVDCGTAVTIDVLDAQGRHLGGLIAPGLGLMRRALAAGTAAIGEAEAGGGRPQGVSLLARSTRDGVTAGTLYALAALVDRAGSDLRAELGEGLVRVLTGGDAVAVAGLLAGAWRHEPTLVLQGLARMAVAAATEAP